MSFPEDFLNDTECSAAGWGPADWVAAAAKNFPSCELRERLPNQWEKSTFFFRGQKNAKYGLKPSLHRFVESGGKNLTEKRISQAERRIINAARSGIGGSSGGDSPGDALGLNLTDGELLAVLQHQEAPTRFLDVSESALVSLYFACEKEDQLDGRVFAIALAGDVEDRNSDSTYRDEGPWLSISSNNELPWPAVETERNAPGDWTTVVRAVDAGGLDPRMSAQTGVFLVGGLARSYAGLNHYWSREARSLKAGEILQVTALHIRFLTTNKKAEDNFPANAMTYRIPAKLKPEIRKLLAGEYGIGEGSIYPDFSGFRRLARNIATWE